MEKKTSKQWQHELPSVLVLDPDGWERDNFHYHWAKEKITKDEYYSRVIRSTCKFDKNNWIDNYDTKKS